MGEVRDQEIQRAFKESGAQEALALMEEYRALGCEVHPEWANEVEDLFSLGSLRSHLASLASDLTKHRSKVV